MLVLMYNMIFYISWWMDVNQACNATSELGLVVMQIFAKLAPSAIFGQKWGVQKELLCAFIACFHLRWLWSHALSRMIIMCVETVVHYTQ